jgi:hypothetical protein
MGSNYYIQKDDMNRELKKYAESKAAIELEEQAKKEAGEDYEENPRGEMTEELGRMFMKLVEGLVRRPEFNRYTDAYKEDMKSSALERMVSQVHKYDPSRSDANPFGFFTMVAYRQFQWWLGREKRNREMKSRYRTKIWEDLCSDEHLIQHNNPEEE